jgi:hypothetical protein
MQGLPLEAGSLNRNTPGILVAFLSHLVSKIMFEFDYNAPYAIYREKEISNQDC